MLPGDRYADRTALSRLLASQKANNGSTAGGLAHALNQGMSGYLMGQNMKDRREAGENATAANQALIKGMMGSPQVYADVDEDGAVISPGQQAVPGGIEGALAAVSGLNTPQGGRLAQQLAIQNLGQQQAEDMMQKRGAMQLQNALALQEAKGPKLTSEQRNYQAGRDDPEFVKFLQLTGKGNTPSSLQEFAVVRDLDERARGGDEIAKRELQLWFANQRGAKTLNLGGTQVVIDPTNPQQNLAERVVTPKPEQIPEFKREQATATAEGKELGKETGIAENSLAASEAALPRLQQAVSELKELGKVATYTLGGQASDFAARQFGMDPSEGAVARAKYGAHVKNNVLPLLRQTFGAAFTAAEGDSLLATLGDPDMHPLEKEAVLDAFITDKMADIETQRRRVSPSNSSWDPSSGAPPSVGAIRNGFVYIGGDAASSESWVQQR